MVTTQHARDFSVMEIPYNNLTKLGFLVRQALQDPWASAIYTSKDKYVVFGSSHDASGKLLSEHDSYEHATKHYNKIMFARLEYKVSTSIKVERLINAHVTRKKYQAGGMVGVMSQFILRDKKRAEELHEELMSVLDMPSVFTVRHSAYFISGAIISNVICRIFRKPLGARQTAIQKISGRCMMIDGVSQCIDNLMPWFEGASSVVDECGKDEDMLACAFTMLTEQLGQAPSFDASLVGGEDG